MTDVFEQHRRTLLGLAYRMLGSMWDAEDVVQEAWLRWSRTDQSEVRDPRGFLITVVSRLALDQLGSARVTREAYVGPWLPEPVSTDALGPLDTVELHDTVSYATLHLLEALTPAERAVFVLREAFVLPYDDIGVIIDASPAACRQLHHRAVQRIDAGAGRFEASPEQHAALLGRFLAAARGGDFEALAAMLSADVVAWSDGGGKVKAALRPFVGVEAVLHWMAAMAEHYPVTRAEVVQVNGAWGVELLADGESQLLTLGIRDGLIDGVYLVRNPDKLRHLARR